MKKFNLDDYDSNYVMNCETEEEANIFTRFLHESGKRWQSGDSYLENTYWDCDKEETCYCFQSGKHGSTGWYTSAPTDLYRNERCTILKFSDFYWGEEEENKSDIHDDSIDMEILKDIPQKKLKRLLGMSREQLMKRICVLENNIERLPNQIEEE